jgi:hypothetical protein
VAFGLMVITRLINLDHTARFTHDESSDLLRMEQLWSTKKITLIGPMSTDNTKVFGSLTYYMWLPAVVLGKFDPVSPAYGMAFWGIFTAVGFAALAYHINLKLFWPVILLLIVWSPLVEASRWAWNPHLILFWIPIALWLYLTRSSPFSRLVCGIFLGLTVHHHYLAAIATAIFIIVSTISHRRSLKPELWLIGGYVLALTPFVIFDLLHPPGLFIGRYLLSGNTPHLANELGMMVIVQRLISGFTIAAETIARGFWALPTLLLILILAIYEITHKMTTWKWLLPVVGQIGMAALLTQYETRYFLPALPFFFVWLLQKRIGGTSILQTAILSTLVLASLGALPYLMTQPGSQPSIAVIRKATSTIASIIKDNNLTNANITTVASPDSDLLAMKYRDVLTLHHIRLKAPSEYDATEHLFVITTGDTQSAREDASVPLLIFKKAHEAAVVPLADKDWKLLWLRF